MKAIFLTVAILAAVVSLSGGSVTDPPLPRGFPGPVPVFMLEGTERLAGSRSAIRAVDMAGGPGSRGAIRAVGVEDVAGGPGAIRRGGAGGSAHRERRWLARARPLGAGAPAWARRMHRRSLLVLRALTDPRSGASVAGAREGWAYVWPRDAGTAAIAFAAAGYRPEARRVARFLLGLDLDAAARFRGTGEPVPGRAAQGDAAGWVRVAARAAGLSQTITRGQWRSRADYQEKSPGDYLGNALATHGSGLGGFVSDRGLTRVEGDPSSGWDSAAAWGVRPFAQPRFLPAIRRTLRRIAAGSGRFGILPSANWDGGEDPWTAPTAWTAWGLADLAREATARDDLATARVDRRAALRLMAALRRAATPLGLIPERVDAHTGAPRSTTPLGWSHAFAILAIRELWPVRAAWR